MLSVRQPLSQASVTNGGKVPQTALITASTFLSLFPPGWGRGGSVLTPWRVVFHVLRGRRGREFHRSGSPHLEPQCHLPWNGAPCNHLWTEETRNSRLAPRLEMKSRRSQRACSHHLLELRGRSASSVLADWTAPQRPGPLLRENRGPGLPSDHGQHWARLRSLTRN